MEHALFAYGTLQLPEVMEKILGRSVQGAPAVLMDYRSGLVARANFPGIVPHLGEAVSGTRLTGFTLDDLQALDLYEGELYRRIRVNVCMQDTPNVLKQSWVYCMAPWAHSRVTNTPWTIEWYREFGVKGRLTYRY